MRFRPNPEPDVTLTIDRYVKDLTEYTSSLDVEWTYETAVQTIQPIIEVTQKHQLLRTEIIKEAIKRISDWHGSRVILQPHYFKNSWHDYRLYASDPFEPVLSTNVTLIAPNQQYEHPEFTWFSDNEIDDVLDVGDTDFFENLPGLQSDYYSLIKELRNPGSTQQKGKVLTLFTARPIRDRSRYLNATTVPVGIFLANQPGHVAGIAIDLADSNQPRDIYKIRIYSQYLILSQDLGSLKYYQTVGNQEVPVIAINLY